MRLILLVWPHNEIEWKPSEWIKIPCIAVLWTLAHLPGSHELMPTHDYISTVQRSAVTCFTVNISISDCFSSTLFSFFCGQLFNSLWIGFRDWLAMEPNSNEFASFKAQNCGQTNILLRPKCGTTTTERRKKKHRKPHDAKTIRWA